MVTHHCMSHPCPICFPNWPKQIYQTIPTPPAGCICPPTSEKTCESLICPRKNYLSAAGPLAVSNGDNQ